MAPVLDGRISWSVVFLVAALVGGLAAADIVHMRPIVAVLLAVIVTLVPVSFLLRGALDDAPPARPAQEGTEPAAGRYPAAQLSRLDTGEPTLPASVTPVPKPSPSTSRPGPATPAPTMPTPVPVPTGLTRNGQAGWWEDGRGTPGAAAQGPGRPVDGSLSRPPAVAPYVPERADLSRALIAQCPNCGSFHLDGKESKHDWRLKCLECDHMWAWRKGDPWPSVQVRPEVRRQLGG